MKLHDIPQGSKVYEDCSDNSEWFTFNRIDGMYSHCTTEKGGTVHLGACTEMAPFKDGFKMKEES